jgi:hypothetical protein
MSSKAMGFPLFCREAALTRASDGQQRGSNVTLREYLFGRRIVLSSPHRKEWVIDRIDKAAGSLFLPTYKSVAGGVYLGRLNLVFAEHPLVSNCRPLLTGRLVERSGSTELHASYRAPLTCSAFFLFWYVILSLFGLSLATSLTQAWPADLWPAVSLPLMALVPIALILFSIRKAEAGRAALLDFLHETAGFEPVRPSSAV